MDAGKQLIQDEKRQERARDVQIQFIDGNHFNVLTKEDEFDKKNPELIKRKKGEIKYYGVLVTKEPHSRDFCTCESAWYGNTDEFKKSSPIAFQCKHLHAARAIRYGDHS